MEILRTENIVKCFGEFRALNGVSISVNKGDVTLIIGPNGSGKSTFLKTLFGLTKIYSGEIIFKDKNIAKVPPHQKARMKIAYLPQTNNVFANLTVEENLKIAGYVLDKDKVKERIEIALDVFPELKDILKRKAGTLSGGQRQFLAMGMALVRDAEVLMLDEPTAQLSPKLAEVIFEKIIEMRDEFGLTILLVEQNAKRALEISDNGYMFVSGRVAFEGTAEELLNHEKFKEYSLGITAI
ncbi:ABC-type branched-chain amino acid transport systems, ATPase component [Methanocaldococcus bathoardescens]|uniref:ABC-type branched-chain amino acid transport systems, ATPase component n=1 Tax=Methanocaldococcus bathoardescens TaxID=1301915 RepID=A0A076LER0_9EURY|nr:ABC transporter ATP-binding protein [Methanocaldococcus bathoardescens]AIJ05307.1 ABC-type branched-chain amino acid transport systems, ATPase component [Methanocaldococcus bathoardescens]